MYHFFNSFITSPIENRTKDTKNWLREAKSLIFAKATISEKITKIELSTKKVTNCHFLELLVSVFVLEEVFSLSNFSFNCLISSCNSKFDGSYLFFIFTRSFSEEGFLFKLVSNN